MPTLDKSLFHGCIHYTGRPEKIRLMNEITEVQISHELFTACVQNQISH